MPGVRGPSRSPRAYAACEALAQSHYENFPGRVAAAAGADAAARRGRLRVRARGRRHRRRRRRAAGGAAGAARDVAAPPARRGRRRPRRSPRRDAATTLIIVGARPLDPHRSICRCRSSTICVSAFGQDTTTTRYASWADVLDYCRRSANPVGRLVLRIAGYRDEALDRSSDALCTALQLTNFWQDFGRDWRAGRLYVPRDVPARAARARTISPAGALTAGVDARDRARASRHARAASSEGRAVCDGVRGRLRFELRLTWLGGTRDSRSRRRARRERS